MENQQDKKKQLSQFKKLYFLLKFIFAFLLMGELYKRVKITLECLGEKIDKNEKKSIFRNFFISAFIYSTLSLAFISSGSYLLGKEIAPAISKSISRVKANKSHSLKRLIMKQDKVSMASGLSLILAHTIIYVLIVSNNSSRKTRVLREQLKKQYSQFTDDKVAFVSFAGAVVEITGFSAIEFCSQDSFWTSINMKVSKDHIAVHPDKRNLVLFKPTFELARRYNWDLVHKT